MGTHEEKMDVGDEMNKIRWSAREGIEGSQVEIGDVIGYYQINDSTNKISVKASISGKVSYVNGKELIY